MKILLALGVIIVYFLFSVLLYSYPTQKPEPWPNKPEIKFLKPCISVRERNAWIREVDATILTDTMLSMTVQLYNGNIVTFNLIEFYMGRNLPTAFFWCEQEGEKL